MAPPKETPMQKQSSRFTGEETGDAGSETESEKTCPECDEESLRMDSQRGETVCEECGLVVEEDEIDHGPEWRAFNSTERNEKSRVGAPTTVKMHDKGLTTSIDWQDKDAYGRSISSEKRSQMHRLRKWQERIRTKDAGERNLQFALSEMDRMASALGIPDDVREVAAVIYRRALEEDLIRGRSIEGVSTAALYAACRQKNMPRSLDEVTEVSRVEQKEISRTYRYVKKELGMHIEPADPKQYIPRFGSELGVSEGVQARARKLLDTASEELTSGKSPTGLAAAALYAASCVEQEKRPQREIAKVAQVTEVTIRNRYQELVEAAGWVEDVE